MKFPHALRFGGLAVPATGNGKRAHDALAGAGSCDGDAGKDDIVDFRDESETGGDEPRDAALPWVVLIVDDDRTVHETTLIALAGNRVKGRPLQFLHAYSASEARQVIVANRDVAVVLLDVVMETHDAGLRLVPVIRAELGRRDVRIIIRTGQPGYAPEQDVTRDYQVDGYLMKARMTRAILLQAIARALEDPGGSGETAH